MSQQDLAAALAGLIVSAPVVYILWRRQAEERQANPQSVAWPIYLAVTDLIYLSWLMVFAVMILNTLIGDGEMPRITDVLVVGSVFVFHEIVSRTDRPDGPTAELHRLVGSGLGLTAGAIGLGWVLWWLMQSVYDTFAPVAGDIEAELGVSILIVGALVWWARWLAKPWDSKPDFTRWIYLVLVLLISLTTFIGVATAIGIIILLFFFEQPTSPAEHFEPLQGLVATAITAGLIWYHHRPRLGQARNEAVRFYEYVMAALGLATGIGAVVGLVTIVFEDDPLIDTNGTLAVSVIIVAAVGWLVWWFFWSNARSAPRAEEAASLARKLYVIGMAVVLGLVAAGAIGGVLLFVFQTVLGLDPEPRVLGTELSLALLAGGATYHLFQENKADSALRKGVESRPYLITVIASHPGALASALPKEATLRVVHRGDQVGTIDDEMAAAIAEETRGSNSIVWVDESGYRVVPGLTP
jgi:hypothetical protein